MLEKQCLISTATVPHKVLDMRRFFLHADEFLLDVYRWAWARKFSLNIHVGMSSIYATPYTERQIIELCCITAAIKLEKSTSLWKWVFSSGSSSQNPLEYNWKIYTCVAFGDSFATSSRKYVSQLQQHRTNEFFISELIKWKTFPFSLVNIIELLQIIWIKFD